MGCSVIYCRNCHGKRWTADRELALDLCECKTPDFQGSIPETRRETDANKIAALELKVSQMNYSKNYPVNP